MRGRGDRSRRSSEAFQPVDYYTHLQCLAEEYYEEVMIREPEV